MRLNKKNEISQWCYNKKRTEVDIFEITMKQKMDQKKNDMNDDYENVKTRINELINPNEIIINNILHFLTLKTITLVENWKKFRRYNV